MMSCDIATTMLITVCRSVGDGAPDLEEEKCIIIVFLSQSTARQVVCQESNANTHWVTMTRELNWTVLLNANALRDRTQNATHLQQQQYFPCHRSWPIKRPWRDYLVSVCMTALTWLAVGNTKPCWCRQNMQYGIHDLIVRTALTRDLSAAVKSYHIIAWLSAET